MKTPNRYLNSSFTERHGNVQRSWKLIRLNANEHHDAGSGPLDHLDDPAWLDNCVRFVERVYIKLDVITKDLFLGAFSC